MSFQTLPIQIAGPSYQLRSKPLSSQQTVNWYQQPQEQTTEKYVLLPFPGLNQVGSFSTELTNRGFHRMSEVLYQVKGTKLYSISALGNHTELGDLPGSDRCVFADDGINMFIVTNGSVYHFSSTLRTIEKVLNDYSGLLSVAYTQSVFIYSGPKFLYVSEVGDGTTIQGAIGSDLSPDGLVRVFVYDEDIWAMNKRTCEAFYFSGTGTPPISKLSGKVFNVGLKAKNSVAATDNYFYFLGDDYSIYRSAAGVAEKVSTDAISSFLQSASGIESASGYTYSMDGYNFYMITVGGKTFSLNESLGLGGWFELSSGLSGERWQGDSIIDCYDKSFVADQLNGKVYNLDFDYYKNDNEPLKRTRVTAPINSDAFGTKGKRIQMSRLELIMETGTGLITGQGDNPRIMIEPSYDGGRTFNSGSWARVGRLGESILKVEFFGLQSFYDVVFRITTTDPVSYTIYSGAIDIRLAGK